MKFHSILFFLLAAAQLFAQPVVPRLQGYVTDQTGTLSRSEIRELSETLSEFERTESTQISVLVISSLEGSDIESFSHAVAEQNGIGQKGKNNGALVLLAINDRKDRIEVGYGLEEKLTDAMTVVIRRKIMEPQFKEGKFYKGILEGVAAMMDAVRGEFSAENAGKKNKKGFPIFPILIIVFFLFSLFSSFGRRRVVGGGRSFGGGFLTGMLLSNIFSSPGRGSSWGSSGGGGFGGFGGGSFGGGGSSGSW